METKPTLLLVEDDVNDVAMFKLALGKNYPPQEVGLVVVHDVPSAIHYLHGTEKFKQREQFPFPYAVVVDLKLPGLSGASLVQWIRVQPDFGNMLVAVWTGSHVGKDIAHLYRLGANSFLSKTDSPEELATDIRDLHAFWNKMGILVNFVPATAPTRKPNQAAKDDFFYRSEDWPGFEPPSRPE
jgi:CheY-like chemotaxis protein